MIGRGFAYETVMIRKVLTVMDTPRRRLVLGDLTDESRTSVRNDHARLSDPASKPRNITGDISVVTIAMITTAENM